MGRVETVVSETKRASRIVKVLALGGGGASLHINCRLIAETG
jgi:hypothetical protein